MITVRPLYDKIVVQKIDVEQKTTSGIIIPSDNKVNTCKGQVIAVGTGKVLNNGAERPLSVNEGDVVAFNTYAGSDISPIVGRQNTFILKEEDILAIIEE